MLFLIVFLSDKGKIREISLELETLLAAIVDAKAILVLKKREKVDS